MTVAPGVGVITNGALGSLLELGAPISIAKLSSSDSSGSIEGEKAFPKNDVVLGSSGSMEGENKFPKFVSGSSGSMEGEKAFPKIDVLCFSVGACVVPLVLLPKKLVLSFSVVGGAVVVGAEVAGRLPKKEVLSFSVGGAEVGGVEAAG